MKNASTVYDDPQQEPLEPGYRVAPTLSDGLAKTLFDLEPPLPRHLIETKIRQGVRWYWEELDFASKNGLISQAGVEKKLELLDRWVYGKLSGANVLLLAQDAETLFPDWIRLMPRLLALRYEELRVARLWSALLNPEALGRLRVAIQMERRSQGFEDF